MMILFTLLWNLVIGATVLFHQPANADDGQFYGGSMKAEMKNLNDNLNQVKTNISYKNGLYASISYKKEGICLHLIKKLVQHLYFIKKQVPTYMKKDIPTFHAKN